LPDAVGAVLLNDLLAVEKSAEVCAIQVIHFTINCNVKEQIN
jgi:hypothetical protein